MERSVFGFFSAVLCVICLICALQTFRKKTVWPRYFILTKCFYQSCEFHSRLLHDLILN